MIERPLKNLEDKVKYQQIVIERLKTERKILFEDCNKRQSEIKCLKERLHVSSRRYIH